MNILSLTDTVKNGTKYLYKFKRTSTLPNEKIVHDFLENLPADTFESYSAKAQDEILTFIKMGDVNANSFIETLITNKTDEKDILNITRNPKTFALYTSVKCQLNKLIQNIKFNSYAEKNSFSTNLSLLALKDKTSFLNFIESLGFKEILKGKLNSSYVKDLKSTDKIGYNHFYDMFDSFEKKTKNRLLKLPGFDEESSKLLLQSMDKTICKDPSIFEQLLQVLENKGDTRVFTKLLKNLKKEITNGTITDSNIIALAKSSICYPAKSDFVMKFYENNKRFNNFRFKNEIESICNPNNKIDDKLEKFILKNKKFFAETDLYDINNFLNLQGADINMLLKLINTYKDSSNEFAKILKAVSENNLEFLKKNLKNGKLSEENYHKLQIMRDVDTFKNPKDWHIVNEIYNETFLPIYKATNNQDIALRTSVELRMFEPEVYEKLKKEGILDLVIQKKLNPQMLILNRGQDFVPEIYQDLELIKQGKSLIKHFDTYDGILNKTSPGDVISVKGKMYINNNGKLEIWHMNEEKFNELFPPVDRFLGRQAPSDCFLFSVIESLYRNPKTRGNYYKMFELKGDDIFVTIPAYKNFNGTIKFSNGEVFKVYGKNRAPKHQLMLEETFARTALRKESNVPASLNPITTNNYEYIYKRIDGGLPDEVLRDFLNINQNLSLKDNALKIAKQTYSIDSRKLPKYELQKMLTDLSKNPKKTTILGVTDGKTYHAISLKSYNPETGVIQVIDPKATEKYTERKLDDFLPELYRIWIADI